MKYANRPHKLGSKQTMALPLINAVMGTQIAEGSPRAQKSEEIMMTHGDMSSLLCHANQNQWICPWMVTHSHIYTYIYIYIHIYIYMYIVICPLAIHVPPVSPVTCAPLLHTVIFGGSGSETQGV